MKTKTSVRTCSVKKKKILKMMILWGVCVFYLPVLGFCVCVNHGFMKEFHGNLEPDQMIDYLLELTFEMGEGEGGRWNQMLFVCFCFICWEVGWKKRRKRQVGEERGHRRDWKKAEKCKQAAFTSINKGSTHSSNDDQIMRTTRCSTRR